MIINSETAALVTYTKTTSVVVASLASVTGGPRPVARFLSLLQGSLRVTAPRRPGNEEECVRALVRRWEIENFRRIANVFCYSSPSLPLPRKGRRRLMYSVHDRGLRTGCPSVRLSVCLGPTSPAASACACCYLFYPPPLPFVVIRSSNIGTRVTCSPGPATVRTRTDNARKAPRGPTSDLFDGSVPLRNASRRMSFACAPLQVYVCKTTRLTLIIIIIIHRNRFE